MRRARCSRLEQSRDAIWYTLSRQAPSIYSAPAQPIPGFRPGGSVIHLHSSLPSLLPIPSHASWGTLSNLYRVTKSVIPRGTRRSRYSHTLRILKSHVVSLPLLPRSTRIIPTLFSSSPTVIPTSSTITPIFLEVRYQVNAWLMLTAVQLITARLSDLLTTCLF